MWILLTKSSRKFRFSKKKKKVAEILIDKAISEPSIEEEEIKAPTAISKTMSCRKTIKHKNTHNV